MHVEGNFLVRAPREKLCAFVLDPTKISRCIPRFKEVKVDSPDAFTVLVKAESGLVKDSFTLRFIVQEKNPPMSAKLLVRGVGQDGKLDMELSVYFDEVDARSSTVRWQAEAKLEGRLASIRAGRSAIGAERFIGELFKCARGELENEAPFAESNKFRLRTV